VTVISGVVASSGKQASWRHNGINKWRVTRGVWRNGDVSQWWWRRMKNSIIEKQHRGAAKKKSINGGDAKAKSSTYNLMAASNVMAK